MESWLTFPLSTHNTQCLIREHQFANCLGVSVLVGTKQVSMSKHSNRETLSSLCFPRLLTRRSVLFELPKRLQSPSTGFIDARVSGSLRGVWPRRDPGAHCCICYALDSLLLYLDCFDSMFALALLLLGVGSGWSELRERNTSVRQSRRGARQSVEFRQV